MPNPVLSHSTGKNPLFSEIPYRRPRRPPSPSRGPSLIRKKGGSAAMDGVGEPKNAPRLPEMLLFPLYNLDHVDSVAKLSILSDGASRDALLCLSVA